MNSEDVNIYFMIPKNCNDENDCEEEMLGTFELCSSYVKSCKWIREQNWKQISKTKQDVVIFQQFEGDVFNILVEEKCLILGYRCLKTCLLEKIPIPSCPTPVYTIPMNNMVVCCSGIPPSEKKRLQLQIGHMGGIYSPNFTKQTTHLITDCVNSVKYAWAVELKIPVYLSSWVQAVWETNLSSTTIADSELFNKHKCPPFYKLNVTSTGLSKKEREDITALINDNGGSYSGKFQSEFTKVLICRKGTTSEKFHAAKKSKIECCSIEWVFESAKAGYALPFDTYRIMHKDYASSTLINQNDTVDPNFSMASTIQGEFRDVSESRFMSTTNLSLMPSKCTPRKDPGSDSNTSVNKIDNLMRNLPDLKEIKKIGPFLDGCCVYLSGFPSEHREKLCKILNLGGAIRYDTVSGHVTHLIGQDYDTSEIEKFHEEGHSPIPLSLEWIIDSIKTKCPAPEEPFRLYPTKTKNTDPLVSPSSPLSKKGVQMLRTNSSVSIPKNNESIEKDDETLLEKDPPEKETDDFMKEYFEKRDTDEPDTLDQFLAAENVTDAATQAKHTSNTNERDVTEKEVLPNSTPRQSYIEKVAPLPVEDSTTNITDLTENSNIFEDLKFSVLDWDDTSEEQIAEIITSCGGTVVFNNRTKVNYAIVPPDGVSKKLNANEVVTNLWVEECFSDNKLLPVKYYHKPVTLKEDTAPLDGCVITLSSYKNYERSFIHWLIEYLGARPEEMLSKKDNRKGIPPSTHLICPTPLGSKYTAAVKWGLHIVTHDWLLACARECKRVPEHLYAVTESDATNVTDSKQSGRSNVSPISIPADVTNNDSKYNSGDSKVAESVSPTNESKEQEAEESVSNAGTSTNEKKHPMDDFFNTRNRSTNKKTEQTAEVASSPAATNSPILQQDISAKNNSLNDETDNKSTPKSDSFLSHNGGSGESQYTPISTLQRFSRLFPDSKESTPEVKNKTPVHVNKLSHLQSPVFSQQMTPVAKFLENLGLPKNRTPDNSPLPLTPSHVNTPDTPLGRCFGNPDPSPETRKYWAKRINALPSYHHTPPPKRPRLNSTPLSELKDRLWKKILPSDYEENVTCDTEAEQENTPTEQVSTPLKNPVVSAQVQQLKDMLQRRASEEGSRRSIARTEDLNEEPTLSRAPVVETQSDTIGWEDPLEVDNSDKTSMSLNKSESSFVLPRRFMLSQIATTERQKYVELIESIGGIISDQITLFDESSTHLVCAALSRNEKMLASVAAGKWVLHTSYLEDSSKAGYFLNEELYEYGNPLATTLSDVGNSPIATAVYRWRTKINSTKQRAYHGMRAIIFVKSRKDQLIRLIEAGGGVVLNEVCSYEDTDATHCFVDPKQINEYPQTKILASNGIYCLPPIYLSNVLIADPPLNPKDCVIPSLLSFYQSK